MRKPSRLLNRDYYHNGIADLHDCYDWDKNFAWYQKHLNIALNGYMQKHLQSGALQCDQNDKWILEQFKEQIADQGYVLTKVLDDYYKVAQTQSADPQI